MPTAFTFLSRTRSIGMAAVLVAVSFLGLAVLVNAQEGQLSATLAGDPSSGQAPLEDVDMAATASGGAGFPLTYRIDCTGDGSYEREFTTSSEQYKAIDLCSYTDAGDYTARLEVERTSDGATATAQTTIAVSSAGGGGGGPTGGGGSVPQFGPGGQFQQDEEEEEGTEEEEVVESFDLTMASRVPGSGTFAGTMNARPGDLVEVRMRIGNVGDERSENVHLRAVLPSSVTYAGNLQMNGTSATGNPTSLTGVRIDSLPVGEAREITFNVRLAETSQWQVGTTVKIVPGIAYNGNKADTASTTLLVTREQAVAAAPQQQPGGTGFSPIFGAEREQEEAAEEEEVLAQEPQPQVEEEERGFLANLTAGNIFEDPVRSILIAALVVAVILIIGLGFVMRKSPS